MKKMLIPNGTSYNNIINTGFLKRVWYKVVQFFTKRKTVEQILLESNRKRTSGKTIFCFKFKVYYTDGSIEPYVYPYYLRVSKKDTIEIDTEWLNDCLLVRFYRVVKDTRIPITESATQIYRNKPIFNPVTVLP